jgi:hypothetical protein
MQETPEKHLKKKKSRNAKSLRKVNLDKLESRLLNIIYRDVNKILVKSYAEQLKESESKTITTYIKTIKEIKKLRQEETDNIPDSELERIIEEKE